jgi:SAM-dependent methyltransferase
VHAKRVCSDRFSYISVPIGAFGVQINQPVVVLAVRSVASIRREIVMSDLFAHWDDRYEQHTTPWDSKLNSQELSLVVEENSIKPGRALDIGCGTGTNAVFLAQQGFQVTAVDCSQNALNQGQESATSAGVEVDWVCADVREWQPSKPFEFIFDRGCFHCVRRENSSQIAVNTLAKFCISGTRLLVLTGNANEQREKGPPQLTEQELRDELTTEFRIDRLREFYFEDAGAIQGPLGWSCLLTRP